MESQWNGYEESTLLGCGVYPLRRTSLDTPNGPSRPMSEVIDPIEGEGEPQDIVDEALYFLKTHLVRRAFPIRGAGDRVILYLTWYLHECIKSLVGLNRNEAQKAMLNRAVEGVVAPVDEGFVFSRFFSPGDDSEQDRWKSYATQLRVEAGSRLVEKIFLFPEEDGTGNKFWMAFAKRPFLLGG
ncbi:ARP2/3 complex subunit, putative [Trypanosoma equiperdum]|uniref:ARP2/3 complex subunit, putative n=5 Tax=Trypanozoon TaxID=39700 RepID=Q38BE7_TRYB2|nr:ARP2/3 complex subunit, putative [Trypanosoma brucei gambiense DAL972]XP_822701.1 ARP2/3 complex subunit, putative [Trypanosoma brucei brucei TREU927]ABF58733.1 ARPC3 [Trypanosoma brucei]RHW69012.1 ARP2/3 complex subunit [Trypanosoma brucei equiperdum]SCU67404.1 ARP2/3 complex subunit, putative [Trypanosoma equiperdum]EAN77873.1 ARP2/3 complex subunit, putative [Trypanosoma brucei brucei TREU927]CBH15472.1 ARP2/3 complex subunit, putative [Trypanosoma brucei gambiense DAL972]|eukprot:XP_011777736.1 ARP2/3 complex subunit, putative [Trypanosoma brucei gambiense DAL972]